MKSGCTLQALLINSSDMSIDFIIFRLSFTSFKNKDKNSLRWTFVKIAIYIYSVVGTRGFISHIVSESQQQQSLT